jgi:hypothetical protein
VERIKSARPKSCRHVHCVNEVEEIVRIAAETIGGSP